jgi:formylglycine-generating enzyme required for sulfatase activity
VILIPRAVAQISADIDIQTYAGLTISGEVGKVYSVENITDLTKTNDATAWCSLEFLQLPASPYLWADKSEPATGKRFYRALAMDAPTNMVFIPPGTFRMGSPTNEVDRYADEGPQTAVIISRGFWMGKYEVTQGEYLELMGNNPSYFNGMQGERDFGVNLDRPVETVNWYEATNYCAALTQRELATGRIPVGTEYRLPTEAEWEYACRAWTSTRFSHGDDPGYTNLTNYAWYRDNSDSQTHPVGQKLPNPWGLHDMHGNVEEWCSHGIGEYSGTIEVDPLGPPTNIIMRGGRSIPARFLRSASRNGTLYPEDGRYFTGLRVVLAPRR